MKKVFKVWLVCIIYFLGAACAGKDINTNKDTELTPYVMDFLKITNTELTTLVSWRFSKELKPNQVAVVNTYTYDDGSVFKEILVSTSKWAKLSPTGRQATMAHEMMHAVYGAKHTKKGLMHKYSEITINTVAKKGLVKSIREAVLNLITKQEL